MALPKYATKEEVELALSLCDRRQMKEVQSLSTTNYIRLLQTTARLYEILDSLQGSLRLLEESLMDSESRKANQPVLSDPRGLPEQGNPPVWYGDKDPIDDEGLTGQPRYRKPPIGPKPSDLDRARAQASKAAKTILSDNDVVTAIEKTIFDKIVQSEAFFLSWNVKESKTEGGNAE